MNKVSPYRDVTVLARHVVLAARPPTRPAALQTTGVSVQNNTGPLGGPVINIKVTMTNKL